MAKCTFPIGRLVWGSCYEAQTKNYDGTPLVIKTGPDAGKPTVKYAFGVAIPKGAEAAAGPNGWTQTPWGQLILAEAQASFARGEWQQQGFAWKITDGDSTAIKKGATRPINQATGYAGHWVLSFSSTYPPKLCREEGKALLTEPGFIKTGYYVQVSGNVSGNKNLTNPGIYLNHEWVNFSAYGDEIFTGTDPASAGFGGALPAGATAAPIGGGFAPGGLPATPGLGAPASPGLGAPQTRTLVQVPGAAYTIEQCRQANPPWTDDQIVAAGYGQWQVSATPAFVATIPNAPALPAAGPAIPSPVAQPVAPVIPATPVAPAAPAAPLAKTIVQVPGAAYTIEQCRQANPPWTDEQIVNAGYATWGTPAPAGVQPVPSFLNP